MRGRRVDVDVAVGEGNAHGGRWSGAGPGSGVHGSRVSPCVRAQARASGVVWCGGGLMIRRRGWRYVFSGGIEGLRLRGQRFVMAASAAQGSRLVR